MADTKQPEITDEMRSLAEQHNLSPADLLKLPDYIELARKLGIELKDLLVNDNSSAISVVNRTQHALVFMDESRKAPGDWRGQGGPGKDGGGALKILPPNRIGPGETGTFLSARSRRRASSASPATRAG
jgi:hypothetical protein